MTTKRPNVKLYFLFIFIIGLTSFTLNAQDKFIVVLDAGHGGKDPGAIANGYREKKIALDVVLKLGKDLEKNNDIKVIYTRKTDKFIELWKRADIANKADADLFISVHCNSVKDSRPYGTETWVLGEKNTDRNFEMAKKENEVIFLEDNYEENYAGFNPSSPESSIAIGIEQEVYIEQSIVLAHQIEENFVKKAKRKSRGLKQRSILVIRNTYMPSLLVELGFISNKKEGKYLNSEVGQNQLAKALKDAILTYKKDLDFNIGKDIIPNSETEITQETPKEIKEETTEESTEVVYKVQISASSKNLELKPYNFNGLKNISKLKIGNLYKYYYGNSSDLNTINQLRDEAIKSGYDSAFIVAFKDGKKVNINGTQKGL